MAGPFPTADDPNEWMFFTLAGARSPGVIARGGIRGFERETGWDEQKGKGTQGASLILTSAPPCKGSIALQLMGKGGINANGTPSQDFANWDAFVVSVLSISADKQKAEGLAIYYPQFASIGLTTVVVAKYKGPEHVGKGLHIATIDLIEWSPPPKVSIVSQVQNVAPDVPDQDDGILSVADKDPRVVRLKSEIGAARAGQEP